MFVITINLYAFKLSLQNMRLYISLYFYAELKFKQNLKAIVFEMQLHASQDILAMESNWKSLW